LLSVASSLPIDLPTAARLVGLTSYILASSASLSPQTRDVDATGARSIGSGAVAGGALGVALLRLKSVELLGAISAFGFVCARDQKRAQACLKGKGRL
jgi:hypothetical protein